MIELKLDSDEKIQSIASIIFVTALINGGYNAAERQINDGEGLLQAIPMGVIVDNVDDGLDLVRSPVEWTWDRWRGSEQEDIVPNPQSSGASVTIPLPTASAITGSQVVIELDPNPEA